MKTIFKFLFTATIGIGAVQGQAFTGVLAVDVSKIDFSPSKIAANSNTFGIDFRFNRLVGVDSKNSFSIFNRTTGLNDIVVRGSEENFEYKRSEILLANRVFDPLNNRIDSFNPNGSKDFGNAVLSGALSLLFN